MHRDCAGSVPSFEDDVIGPLISFFLVEAVSLAPTVQTYDVDLSATREGAAPGRDDEIVVTARRIDGSVIGDIPPAAAIDADTIRSLGATSLAQLIERLRPQARSFTGEEPGLLLNGRRIAGFADIQSIPPEAIERTEILSEQDAVRFGFPPTVRVMNFITRKRFRAATLQQLSGVTSEGGGQTSYTELNSTRIDGSRRLTGTVNYFRQNPVFQSERNILPDPAVLYALGGNVGGLAGGSLDSRLDALAGRRVTAAPLPASAAARGVLTSYAAATAPAVTDIGRYRTIEPQTDTLHLDGAIAVPIGRTINGSFNLSMDAKRVQRLNGLAQGLFQVPPGGLLPFTGDVLLYRYFPAALRQQNDSTALQAGGTLQGRMGRWVWDATGSGNWLRATATSQQGVPLQGLRAAIEAGSDPLASLDPDSASQRLIDRGRSTTGTLAGKLVATGPLVRLPAGTAQLTLSADYARSSASGRVAEMGDEPKVRRIVRGASASVSLPLVSPERDFLHVVGRLSATAMLGASEVAGFGRLTGSSVALNWAPVPALEFTASMSHAQFPPDIALLTAPIVTSPNTPFFDFVTGESVFVDAVSGGNPSLTPERRRVTTYGIAVTPIRNRDLRINLEIIDTDARNLAVIPGGAIAPVQRAFPNRFVRDASGGLVTVDLRSLNIARERERKLRLTTNFTAKIGRSSPSPAAKAEAQQPSPPPSPPRATVSSSVSATLRLDDAATLGTGSPTLDLLDGATLDGSGGRPRWEIDATLGTGIGALNVGTYARLQGPTRVQGDLAASDLHFSGRTWVVLYGSLDAEKLVRTAWTKRLTIQFTIENLLNDRINVRDRTGAVPNRYQAAYLDPIGRSIRIGVRKLF
jgi:hypothetical protein